MRNGWTEAIYWDTLIKRTQKNPPLLLGKTRAKRAKQIVYFVKSFEQDQNYRLIGYLFDCPVFEKIQKRKK